MGEGAGAREMIGLALALAAAGAAKPAETPRAFMERL
jgi:hypothetical protein